MFHCHCCHRLSVVNGGKGCHQLHASSLASPSHNHNGNGNGRWCVGSRHRQSPTPTHFRRYSNNIDMTVGLQLFGMAIILLPSSAIRNSMFANAAYASDSSGVHQHRQRLTSTDIDNINNNDKECITSSFHVERPLSPPFPNGPCDGTVITIPQQDLFPSQRRRASSSSSSSRGFPFFNNWDDLASSYEDAILPPRDVKVWFPREYHSYENHSLRFPVLYCHDGQNGET